jgi:hypothetical protein
MYRNRDDLQALVNMLSKGEKRYFINFFKGYDTGQATPLFLQLYALMEKGESELPKVFSADSPQALTTTKRRLYRHILKSMRSLHDDTSIDMVIQNQLSEIEILYRLGLPEQGMFLLKKTYLLARTHEKFGLVLQILEWEKRLNIVMDTPSRPTAEIVAEEKAVLRMYGQVMELESLFSHAKELKKQYGFVMGAMREKLEKETIHAPGMPAAKACLSDKATYYYNFIHALYYWMVFDHSKAYDYSRQLLTSKVKVVLPSDYIDGIFEHITSSVCVASFDDALAGINLGAAYVEEQKLNQSHAFMLRMFAYQGTYQLIIYNYMGDREKLLATISDTEGKLKLYESVLPFETKQVIIGNLMNAYMGIGDLAKADAIWEGMFNRHSQTVRRDIYADLHLFRLFSLLQSKTYALLPSAAGAALRYFRRFEDAKTVFEVELPIALLLNKERDYHKPALLGELLEQISAIVTRFIAGLKGVAGFQEHYSRYLIWSEAILKDEAYYITAARWYKKFKDHTV